MALDFDVNDIEPALTLISDLNRMLNTLSSEEGPYVEALKVGILAAISVIEEAVADAYRELATGDIAETGISSQIIDQELDNIIGETSSSEEGTSTSGE